MREKEKMAASINGVGGVGFGGLTCSTKTPLPSSRSSSFRVQMSVPDEDKKRNYTLQKSQEAFNAALVIFSSFPSLPTCGLFEFCLLSIHFFIRFDFFVK